MGGSGDRSVDVRVVVATEKDVAEETEHGTFRRSLGQRLAGIVVRVPVRRAGDYSDIELQVAAQRLGGNVEEISKALSVSTRGLRLRLRRARIDRPIT